MPPIVTDAERALADLFETRSDAFTGAPLEARRKGRGF
jgi:hypothetical protein